MKRERKRVIIATLAGRYSKEGAIPRDETVKVQIVRVPQTAAQHQDKEPALPYYASAGAAGMDLTAAIDEQIHLAPGARCLIPTGIAIALPEGYEAQVRSRSGLALKRGLAVLNAPGTIDSDYRGEIKVILINHSEETACIEPGERIAQLVVARYERVEWDEVTSLDRTERGDGGFGHTGTTSVKA